eukprot:388962_1
MSNHTPLSLIPDIYDTTRRAFNNGLTIPYSFRIEQLENLRRLVKENKDAIIAAEQADMYKRPRKELQVTATGHIIEECNHLISNLSNYMSPQTVPEANAMGKGKIVYSPRGNCLIIGPWNFPTNLVLVPLSGAIAAGCTAIIKPSEVAENVSILIQKLIPKYLDTRCYKVVTGAVPQTSALLKYKFGLIFFTGGPGIGKIIAKAAAKYLTPCVLELGGKNPVVVDDKINLDKVAKQIVTARYGLNCGQVCTAPEYVILSKWRQEMFINCIKKAIKKRFGENEKESNRFSRIKNIRHFKRLQKVILENRNNIVYGGNSDVNDIYIQPTIVSDANMSTPIMRDEVFGPILTIYPVSDVN